MAEDLERRVDEYLNNPIDWETPEGVAFYDELSLWSAMFGAVLLRNVSLKPGLEVLDLACGTGFPAIELAQRLGATSRVYGLDPWKNGLARARQKILARQISNLYLILGDGAAMPFHDGQFDLITSNLGINNFENAEAVLTECARVANANAQIVLTTNPKGHMHEFYEVFETTLKELGKTDCFDALEENINHRVSIETIRYWLDGAGFRIRKIHEESFTMRFLDGSALLRHSFIRLGFLDAWKGIVPSEDEQRVFAGLERNLNRAAASQGELVLTIPLAYIEGEKLWRTKN